MAVSPLSPKHGLFDLTVISAIVLISIICIAVVDTGMTGMASTPATPAGPAVPPAPPAPPEPVVIPFSGRTAEGSSTDVDGGELTSSVKSVSATLQWVDDFGNNDVFRLDLLVNGTVVSSSDGSSGELLAEASGPLSGTLSARITAVDCPGLVSVSPVDRDSGNSWQLVLEIIPEG